MKKFLKRFLNIFTVLSFVYFLGFFYNLIVDQKPDWSLIGIFGGILIFVGGLNYLIQGKFVFWNTDVGE